MKQVSAAFSKGIKDSFMSKPALFWTIAWPILWMILGFYVFLRQVPEEFLSIERGRQALSMTIFAIMISGMSNIPAAISEDRQRGLFLKLKSMPVRPWKESIGRISSILVFSIFSVTLILVIGIALGGRFSFNVTDILITIALILLCMFASSGVGLIIGTLIKNMQGAIMTGVGVAVVSSAISGIFFPYEMLPKVLQRFSDIWPMSSINSLVLYYMTDRNPAISPIGLQFGYTIAFSLLLFVIGLILYSKYCWKSE